MTLMQIFPFLRDLGPLSVLIRFLTACLCGAVIGYSRGRQQRPAGFRTHVLVCLGAASTVIMSQFSIEILGVPGDTMRVPAQVISGIGFLGAGSIIVTGRNHNHISGVTTAAGLWATGAMGLVCGAGYVECALLMCLIIYIVQVPLYRLDSRRVKLTHMLTTYVEVDSDLQLSKLMTALKEADIMLNTIDPFGPEGGEYDGYKLELEIMNRSLTPDEAMEHLRAIPSVRFAQRLDESRS